MTTSVGPPASGAFLEVVRAGPATTVQDLGRPGLAALGVTRSGAADRRSLRLANRLVANPEGAAGLEVTLGGLAVRAGRDLDLAVTGAACPITVDGRPAGRNAVLHVPAGRLVTLGPAAAGLRAYVAVRGGIDVAPVLGSRARDTLAGLGPDVVRDGDRLPVGRPPDLPWPGVDLAPVADPPAGDVLLDAVAGPREGLVPDGVRAAMWSARWVVDAASDRVGVRLAPPDAATVASSGGSSGSSGSMASEGVVRGAVQVPPSGLPVVFLADHPVTGGYPVVAVLLDAAADRAAQLRPGQGVRFRRVRPPRLG
ncbi:MAG: biotin-dependent carboxyltransferase family protein [Kineosporiaceae bacterium]